MAGETIANLVKYQQPDGWVYFYISEHDAFGFIDWKFFIYSIFMLPFIPSLIFAFIYFLMLELFPLH